MYYLLCIWYCKDNLYQNFKFILVWKMNKMTDKYNKNKNKELIILIMKFKGYYIINIYINKRLIILFIYYKYYKYQT